MSNDFRFCKTSMETYQGKAQIYSLNTLREVGYNVDRLPYAIKILLENALRYSAKGAEFSEAAHLLASWPKSVGSEIPFMPSRVLLQDYTGVPLIVDLAAMRSALQKKGMNPKVVDSKVPVDLVIDHSIQVDSWQGDLALAVNMQKEYERNSERYSFLKWAQSSFDQMKVFPPGKGICHQVNLEFLATAVTLREHDGELSAFPDTVIGTDSHTPMINGLGVLGWGVGGIEAEAVMLGEPYYMRIPRVFGVKLKSSLKEGATPTDLVLTVTETLRRKGVVGEFVEYFGDGYSELTVADRATIGNMSPEYGATVGISPVDDATITYLLGTGRDPRHASFVKDYCVKQGLFVHPDSPQPDYSEVVEIALDTIEPCIAGPRNPEERVPLHMVPSIARDILDEHRRKSAQAVGARRLAGYLDHGSIVIAAITSCTNTSNPSVMVGAGLLADRAVRMGLTAKDYVKRSLAPGSLVVKDYLEDSNLLPSLKALGFNLVGYGCTTCIGNSGPLDADTQREISENELYSLAVLSGNRNFDGRIHPLVKGTFLMSPMLVVAYALAGRIDFDFLNQPLGYTNEGKAIYLRDIWPSLKEIREVTDSCLKPELYRERYFSALKGDERWENLRAPSGDVYVWDERSTYIREPPWFDRDTVAQDCDTVGARVLALVEDKITTDHISPAGSILASSPAGSYLKRFGVAENQFSTYGARRGDHEVMVRGGFHNIRLRNMLAEGREGGFTTHFPSGELMTIYHAAMRYRSEGVPLIILAGKQYGTGSSRDWAAKATKLLGVRAVLAESFERIHRGNLVAMGVLPLQFADGEGWNKLGLKGEETFDIQRVKEPGSRVDVKARSGYKEVRFRARVRIDNSVEMQYFASGGILPYIFKKIVSGSC